MMVVDVAYAAGGAGVLEPFDREAVSRRTKMTKPTFAWHFRTTPPTLTGAVCTYSVSLHRPNHHRPVIRRLTTPCRNLACRATRD